MGKVKIKVKVFMTLKEPFGWGSRVIELDNDPPRFRDLISKVPEIKGAIEKYKGERWSLIILLNGRRIEFLGGFDSVLEDRDVISIFPPLAGG